MNLNSIHAVKLKSHYLAYYASMICAVFCLVLMYFQSVHGQTCSSTTPDGACPSGQACLSNAGTYGCYGKCDGSNFGACPTGQVCLVSLTNISADAIGALHTNPTYSCFTCMSGNPLGTCPAGLACVTCNGATLCVTSDFTCSKQNTPTTAAPTTQVPAPTAATTTKTLA
jgi:hypothetical protein